MRTVRVIGQGDNYSYLVYSQGTGWVIDPKEVSPIVSCLEEEELSLAAIFLTHEHWDHTAGAQELADLTGAVVRGGATGVPFGNEEVISLPQGDLVVLPTPGHTRGDYSYYLTPRGDEPGVVFTGDTLFLGGCGRVFSGDPGMLWRSLVRLSRLEPDTLIYCGHEYTRENYRFICSLDPENDEASRYLETLLSDKTQVTVPRSLGEELKSNPFLGAGRERLADKFGLKSSDSQGIFICLRELKDRYREED